jgi:hypothetical protein
MHQGGDPAFLLPHLDVAIDDALSSGGDGGLIALRLDDVQLKHLAAAAVKQICSVRRHDAASFDASPNRRFDPAVCCNTKHRKRQR